MSANDRKPSDDFLADVLVEFDEALAAGSSEAPKLMTVEVDAEKALDLEREMACVRLLREIWPPREVQAAAGEVLPLPAMMGRFELGRLLGRGGFGTVFLAFDPVLRREVALKVPRPGTLASPEMRRRFVREAQAAAGLNHPNIVSIHEAGEFGAIGYLVSAYITGPTLAEWVRTQVNPIPVRAAAAMVADVADAVEHAHQHGILHRDIKPSNVLLEPVPTSTMKQPERDSLSEFIPKLTDFGLARMVENDGDETKTGAMLGTPRYMAPEQVEGRHDRLGPPTDVYALGAILYEVLAGRPPHVGESDVETLFAVAHSEPDSVSRWRPGIPRDLETICQRCLAKAPSERYPSAGDLADDLRCFLAGEPIRARPIGIAERSVRWAHRRPALAALVVVGILSLCGFVAGGIAYTVNLREARDIAEQQRLEALDRERTIRHHIYAAEMQLAHHAYRNTNQSQLQEILQRHQLAETSEDVRGFEWHYLWRLCHCERMTLHGHQGDVYCAMFSPDGRSLVTGGKDRTVRVWDVETGTLQRELHGHKNEIGSVSFAPTGSQFITSSEDGTIRRWDHATGRQLAEWRPVGALIGCALFSPDGRTLATGDREGRLRLWDATSGRAVASSPGVRELIGGLSDDKRQQMKGARKTSRIMALAVSPDGKSLVAFREDGAGQMWDLATQSLRFELPRRNNSINGVAFSPSSETIATADNDGTVELWNSVTGRQIASLSGHANQVEAVAFSSDGRLLASAGRDTVVRLWSLSSGSLHAELRGHSATVWSVSFSPDGRTLATASQDGLVKLWNVSAELDRQPLETSDSAPVLAVAVAPDSHSVTVARRNGRMEWLRMDDLRTRATAIIPGTHANALAYAPDGSLVSAACEDGTICLFDATTSQMRDVLRNHTASALCVAFSPDGTMLASGSEDGRCVLWNRHTQQSLRVLTGHASGVTAVAFLPHGNLLASASRDKSIRLWDPATGKERGLLQHGGAVQSIEFSADCKLLAAVDGQSVSLWQATAAGGWTGPFVHNQTARRLSLGSHAGKPVLAVVGADSFLRAFYVNSPSSLTDLGVNGRSHSTTCAAFSQDGKALVSGDLNGSVTIWEKARMLPRTTRSATRVGGGPISFSADGKLLAIGALTGHVHLFRPFVGGTVTSIGPFPDAPISSIAFAPGGDALAVLVGASTHFWSNNVDRAVARPWDDRRDVGAIAISPDGSVLVVASGCGGPKTQIVVWNLRTGQEVGRLPEQPTCDHPRLAIAPDGKLLVAAIGNLATIWDITTQNCCAKLPVHNGRIATVAFSSDGKMLATAGELDRTVRIFDVHGIETPSMTLVHPATVTALAFAADNRTLAVGGADGRLRFSSVRTGHEVMTLDAHKGGVVDLAFAPDDSVLATSGKSAEGAGEIFLWYGRPLLGQSSLERDRN